MGSTQETLPGIKKQVGRPRKYTTDKKRIEAHKKQQKKYRDKKKYSKTPQIERSFMVDVFETERLLGKGKEDRSAKLREIIAALYEYKQNAEMAIDGGPRHHDPGTIPTSGVAPIALLLSGSDGAGGERGHPHALAWQGARPDIRLRQGAAFRIIRSSGIRR